jgi:hypothetical protein
VHAGWECRFSAEGGRPLRVPDTYLPEALAEWGVEVFGFESLTYEKFSLIPGALEATPGSVQLSRVGARFLPEAGCGCDNVGKEVRSNSPSLLCLLELSARAWEMAHQNC